MEIGSQKLQDWIDWELEAGIHSPERIKKGESREENLVYAFDRLEKELEEAAEVVEVYQRFQAGEEVDIDQLEYTSNIDTKYDSLETQIGDEIGYELADVSLFLLKAATVLESQSSRDETAQEIGKLFNGRRNIEISVDGNAIAELQGEFNPEVEGSLAVEAPLNLESESRLGWILEETASYLNSVTRGLPRNLSDYVEEKIEYNQDREIEKMDASFKIRDKWKKLLKY